MTEAETSFFIQRSWETYVIQTKAMTLLGRRLRGREVFVYATVRKQTSGYVAQQLMRDYKNHLRALTSERLQRREPD
ncbi:MAG TPA: hypothetical protein VHX60_09695 [Acidobacteriaceae bacterium]|nr:hypothetical protein [Acidobacteriaceae bacterium]